MVREIKMLIYNENITLANIFIYALFFQIRKKQ